MGEAWRHDGCEPITGLAEPPGACENGGVGCYLTYAYFAQRYEARPDGLAYWTLRRGEQFAPWRQIREASYGGWANGSYFGCAMGPSCGCRCCWWACRRSPRRCSGASTRTPSPTIQLMSVDGPRAATRPACGEAPRARDRLRPRIGAPRDAGYARVGMRGILTAEPPAWGAERARRERGAGETRPPYKTSRGQAGRTSRDHSIRVDSVNPRAWLPRTARRSLPAASPVGCDRRSRRPGPLRTLLSRRLSSARCRGCRRPPSRRHPKRSPRCSTGRRCRGPR